MVAYSFVDERQTETGLSEDAVRPGDGNVRVIALHVRV
jgi:hypothetical protein